MTVSRRPETQLRRLAVCRDDLREPLNATERSERPGNVPYWGANSIQDFVDEAKLDFPVVLLGEDGAPFFDKARDVAFFRNEPIWPNNHIHVLVPNENVDGRWLAYALNNVDYSRVINGSTRDKLTQSAMMSIVLPMVYRVEQQEIADYLDRETQRIDDLIAEQRGLIETLRERRRAVLDFAFLRHASRIKSLRRLLEVSITGPFGTQLQAGEYVDDGVPVVNPTHIARSRIRPDMSVTVTPDKARELERFRLHQGDVVLGRKGDVDKAAIVTLREEGYICGSDSMALRPSAGMHGEYLWWYLQSPSAHRQLEEWSVGSTVAGLNQRTISRLEVPTVDLSQQVETSSFLVGQTTQIDTLISDSEDLIALSQERRAALITAAVTGQIDVRTAA